MINWIKKKKAIFIKDHDVILVSVYFSFAYLNETCSKRKCSLECDFKYEKFMEKYSCTVLKN